MDSELVLYTVPAAWWTEPAEHNLYPPTISKELHDDHPEVDGSPSERATSEASQGKDLRDFIESMGLHESSGYSESNTGEDSNSGLDYEADADVKPGEETIEHGDDQFSDEPGRKLLHRTADGQYVWCYGRAPPDETVLGGKEQQDLPVRYYFLPFGFATLLTRASRS